MTPREYLKGKNVLVVVLGIHGGGVATAKWLFSHGAHVTVTDFRTKDELKGSLAKFTQTERKGIRFALGGQDKKDFEENDIVVLGPGVPRESPYLAAAVSAKRELQNDASLFFRFVQNPVIGVTGTRGKTTTTHWIAQLLSKKYGAIVPTGNNPDNPFLAELRLREKSRDRKRPVVAEASSWQLEYMNRGGRAPQIAVITNLFPDHLNRYGGSLEEYARAKAEIFRLQNTQDTLILNVDNAWTSFFLKQKPKARVLFFSKKTLAKGREGVFCRGGHLFVRIGKNSGKKDKKVCSIKKFTEQFGEHNLENMMAAVAAILALDPKIKFSERDLLYLKCVPMRQETIFEKRGLRIVNDSTATSPDGTIAAIKRFKNDRPVLIAGGTDKDLEMRDLARTIKKYVPPSRLVLLDGSATKKLIVELARTKYPKKFSLRETLQECVADAYTATQGKGTILFSPGAASFEKFKNEFDRGKQFNALVRRR
ncbi:MAG: UDP-N-acetylmuramoyl-L-alanine--D-glutamate ligase [Minisyncoccota bacterium]